MTPSTYNVQLALKIIAVGFGTVAVLDGIALLVGMML
jgi:hypothetical protein